ncbi:MAG: tRNA (adenosine(37)-N6)-dimethylallyltransferase MiaA, partial [Acetobacteraceae bacterium]
IAGSAGSRPSAAIAARFDAMLDGGAMEEVRGLAALGLDPALPAMRAHGVPELMAHIQGRMTLEAARDRAVLHTGQYTKRQATWFRHHPLADPTDTHIIHARVEGLAQFQESQGAEIFAFVESRR